MDFKPIDELVIIVSITSIPFLLLVAIRTIDIALSRINETLKNKGD